MGDDSVDMEDDRIDMACLSTLGGGPTKDDSMDSLYTAIAASTAHSTVSSQGLTVVHISAQRVG